GFGVKCGIPLRGEAEGRVPNDEYMKATHGRRLLNGDIANLSIGQGDVQVTPLQMAQAMAIAANGGTFYQTRLVQQVQTFNNEIVTAYQVRAKRTLNLSSQTLDELRTGMVDVVNGAGGSDANDSQKSAALSRWKKTNRINSGERTRLACWRWRPRHRELLFSEFASPDKAHSARAPNGAREARALPGSRRGRFFRQFHR